MSDIFDTATRSRIMRAIRSKDTKPELALAAVIVAAGMPERCTRWTRTLPGRPDFAFPGQMLAVFLHGCFWHLCPRHYKPPAGAAWRAKMDRNRRRDVRVRRQLRALGWRTMVVWEHDDPSRAAERIRRRIARIHVTISATEKGRAR